MGKAPTAPRRPGFLFCKPNVARQLDSWLPYDAVNLHVSKMPRRTPVFTAPREPVRYRDYLRRYSAGGMIPLSLRSQNMVSTRLYSAFGAFSARSACLYAKEPSGDWLSPSAARASLHASRAVS